MELGFEPVSGILLILPPILLIVAAGLHYFVFTKKEASSKDLGGISAKMQNINELLKKVNFNSIEEKIKELEEFFGDSKSFENHTGMILLKELKEFYASRIRDVVAYSRNPNAFSYEFAKSGKSKDVIVFYEAKVKQLKEEIEKKPIIVDENEAEKNKQLAKEKIENIKKELNNLVAVLESINKNISEEDLDLLANVKSSTDDKDPIISIALAGLGLAIGLYVVVTNLSKLF